MTTAAPLAKLDKATQMLAEVRKVDEAKNIIDLAEAARVYAKQVDLGLEAQNHAAEIKLRAQRKAGEILSRMEKAKGGERYHRSQPATSAEIVPTYEELEITKQDASRWQQIASLPAETFESFIAETKDEEKELTTASVLRVARENNKETKPVKIPDGKYRVIYADPPWKYGNTMPDNFGEQADHYKLMTVDEIAALPIKNLAQDNAVLFLWVTSPILEESFQVVNAWGFTYKSSFVWDKVKHVMGHYNSVRHEILLVCVRGSCQPDVQKLFDSVYSEERTEHSRKPEYFREIIDTIYPNGKRIELFARKQSDGWDVWGNDVP